MSPSYQLSKFIFSAFNGHMKVIFHAVLGAKDYVKRGDSDHKIRCSESRCFSLNSVLSLNVLQYVYKLLRP